MTGVKADLTSVKAGVTWVARQASGRVQGGRQGARRRLVTTAGQRDPLSGQLAKGASQMQSSAPVWRKSSHSNGNCVEIAWRRGAVGINILVRDSKFPSQEPLVFTPREWAVFLERVKSADLDVLAGPRAAEWGDVLPIRKLVRYLNAVSGHALKNRRRRRAALGSGPPPRGLAQGPPGPAQAPAREPGPRRARPGPSGGHRPR